MDPYNNEKPVVDEVPYWIKKEKKEKDQVMQDDAPMVAEPQQVTISQPQPEPYHAAEQQILAHEPYTG